MCGIGGILRTDGAAIPDAWLDAIDRRVASRGPDGHGRFAARGDGSDGPVEIALVHRRLSIIDLTDGHQPMVADATDTHGRLAVVFNGCIYNHRALRAELERLGHRFRTDHSDTEVLLHGYRAWGDELPAHLEGMYAFAVWDEGAGRLFLARDAFGEKPLYVRETTGDDGRGVIIAFASEPQCLGLGRRGGGDERDARGWLRNVLRFGYAPSGASGVHLLPAGGRAAAIVPAGRATAPGLTVLPATPRPVGASGAGDAADLIETHLRRAVEDRLEADVPLGCFLSGGVDSSLVAAFAAQRAPDLETFCVRMPDPRYDESRFAADVAAHIGTRHTTLDVTPRPAEDLVHLVDRLGQPFGDSSILPTYWVSAAARAHVAVALSGDGGDELFLGYERYRAARTLMRARPLLAGLPAALLRGAHPKSWRNRFGRLGEMARNAQALGVVAAESIFTEAQLDALLGPDDASPVPPAGDPLAVLRQWDIDHYLPDDLLRKVDTASMAVALEVRCPFLDRRLAATALGLPFGALSRPGTRKGLLRTVARRHLPTAIVDRPKMGFAVPIGEWFRNDHGGLGTLLTDALAGPDAFGPFPIDHGTVQKMIDEHRANRRDHTHRLFMLLTVALWVRTFA